MIRTLLLFAVLYSSALSAQNWMPINPSDSIWQYQSKSLSTLETFKQVHFIQSLVADTIYSSGNFQQLIFKKGYSHSAIEKEKLLGNLAYKQIIKGKILGDSARVYADSTLFSSIDSFGFRLQFPHRYTVSNVPWDFAYSNNRLIKAITYQKSFENIPGFGMDSLAKFYLLVFDANGNADYQHHWSNALMTVSKNHGIVELPDLTQLDMRLEFSKLNWPGTSIYRLNNQILNAGDEYHYTKMVDDRTNFNNIVYEYQEYEIHITGVSLNGNTMTISFQRYFQKRSYPNGPIITPLQVSSRTRTAQVNLLFQKKHSGTIDDSLLLGPVGGNSTSLNYYYHPSNPIAPLGLYTDHLVQYNDTVYRYIRLATDIFYYMIGVGHEFNKYTSFGSGQTRESKQVIHYVKKGNQAWGTPLNLSTGLDEQNKKYLMQIYPNPTSNQLHIQSEKQFESIEIRNLRGQLIRSQPFAKELDVSDLPLGIYFLKMIQADGVQIQKFIKN